MEIRTDDYVELIEIKSKYSMLINSMFKNTGLNYRKDGLEFAYGDAYKLIEYLEPEQYNKKVKELKRIEEEKKKEENK